MSDDRMATRKPVPMLRILPTTSGSEADGATEPTDTARTARASDTQLLNSSKVTPLNQDSGARDEQPLGGSVRRLPKQRSVSDAGLPQSANGHGFGLCKSNSKVESEAERHLRHTLSVTGTHASATHTSAFQDSDLTVVRPWWLPAPGVFASPRTERLFKQLCAMGLWFKGWRASVVMLVVFTAYIFLFSFLSETVSADASYRATHLSIGCFVALVWAVEIAVEFYVDRCRMLWSRLRFGVLLMTLAFLLNAAPIALGSAFDVPAVHRAGSLTLSAHIVLCLALLTMSSPLLRLPCRFTALASVLTVVNYAVVVAVARSAGPTQNDDVHDIVASILIVTLVACLAVWIAWQSELAARVLFYQRYRLEVENECLADEVLASHMRTFMQNQGDKLAGDSSSHSDASPSLPAWDLASPRSYVPPAVRRLQQGEQQQGGESSFNSNVTPSVPNYSPGSSAVAVKSPGTVSSVSPFRTTQDPTAARHSPADGVSKRSSLSSQTQTQCPANSEQGVQQDKGKGLQVVDVARCQRHSTGHREGRLSYPASSSCRHSKHARGGGGGRSADETDELSRQVLEAVNSFHSRMSFLSPMTPLSAASDAGHVGSQNNGHGGAINSGGFTSRSAGGADGGPRGSDAASQFSTPRTVAATSRFDFQRVASDLFMPARSMTDLLGGRASSANGQHGPNGSHGVPGSSRDSMARSPPNPADDMRQRGGLSSQARIDAFISSSTRSIDLTGINGLASAGGQGRGGGGGAVTLAGVRTVVKALIRMRARMRGREEVRTVDGAVQKLLGAMHRAQYAPAVMKEAVEADQSLDDNTRRWLLSMNAANRRRRHSVVTQDQVASLDLGVYQPTLPSSMAGTPGTRPRSFSTYGRVLSYGSADPGHGPQTSRTMGPAGSPVHDRPSHSSTRYSNTTGLESIHNTSSFVPGIGVPNALSDQSSSSDSDDDEVDGRAIGGGMRGRRMPAAGTAQTAERGKVSHSGMGHSLRNRASSTDAFTVSDFPSSRAPGGGAGVSSNPEAGAQSAARRGPLDSTSPRTLRESPSELHSTDPRQVVHTVANNSPYDHRGARPSGVGRKPRRSSVASMATKITVLESLDSFVLSRMASRSRFTSGSPSTRGPRSPVLSIPEGGSPRFSTRGRGSSQPGSHRGSQQWPESPTGQFGGKGSGLLSTNSFIVPSSPSIVQRREGGAGGGRQGEGKLPRSVSWKVSGSSAITASFRIDSNAKSRGTGTSSSNGTPGVNSLPPTDRDTGAGHEVIVAAAPQVIDVSQEQASRLYYSRRRSIDRELSWKRDHRQLKRTRHPLCVCCAKPNRRLGRPKGSMADQFSHAGSGSSADPSNSLFRRGITAESFRQGHGLASPTTRQPDFTPRANHHSIMSPSGTPRRSGRGFLTGHTSTGNITGTRHRSDSDPGTALTGPMWRAGSMGAMDVEGMEEGSAEHDETVHIIHDADVLDNMLRLSVPSSPAAVAVISTLTASPPTTKLSQPSGSPGDSKSTAGSVAAEQSGPQDTIQVRPFAAMAESKQGDGSSAGSQESDLSRRDARVAQLVAEAQVASPLPPLHRDNRPHFSAFPNSPDSRPPTASSSTHRQSPVARPPTVSSSLPRSNTHALIEGSTVATLATRGRRSSVDATGNADFLRKLGRATADTNRPRLSRIGGAAASVGSTMLSLTRLTYCRVDSAVPLSDFNADLFRWESHCARPLLSVAMPALRAAVCFDSSRKPLLFADQGGDQSGDERSSLDGSHHSRPSGDGMAVMSSGVPMHSEGFAQALPECYRFLDFIDAGYRSRNPYHNATHAASVVWDVQYYLLHGGIGDHVPLTDRFAAVIAAAIHDYRHPGVNNSYLIASGHDIAIAHNDDAVLERYHVASAFEIVRRHKLRLFAWLSADQYSRVRATIIALVLATDVSRHFELTSALKKKAAKANAREAKLARRNGTTAVSPPNRAGASKLPSRSTASGASTAIDGEEASPPETFDPIFALSVAVVLGDLGHAAKTFSIHREWTARITEEFFRQGDRERRDGLAISPLCDRESVVVSKSQVGFFEYVVLPLFEAAASAKAAVPIAEHAMTPLVKQVRSNLSKWKRIAAASGQGSNSHASMKEPSTPNDVADATGAPAATPSKQVHPNQVTPTAAAERTGAEATTSTATAEPRTPAAKGPGAVRHSTVVEDSPVTRVLRAVDEMPFMPSSPRQRSPAHTAVRVASPP